jgi:Ni,Fe-hydrogenase maturation factor
MESYAKSSATEPRVLLIALGNPLRGDDGVAQEVLALLAPRSNVFTEAPLDILPEMAAALAGFDLVVFIDADVRAVAVRIEELGSPDTQVPVRSPLTHAGDLVSLVGMAARLFGFSGRAVVLRIPARNFHLGEGSSPEAMVWAATAARELQTLLLSNVHEQSAVGPS